MANSSSNDNWSGKLTPAKDTQTKPFEPAMSPLSTPLKDGTNISKAVSNNIIRDMKFKIDHTVVCFQEAEELKQQIDGRKWSFADKNLLNQAEADYKEIQSEKENIHASLNEIGSLFYEKKQQSTKLSEQARNIESKLNEIDNHLNEYGDKLKLLEEKGDDKTDEEIAWETEARKLISKLKYERYDLSNSLTDNHSLQTDLDNAENTTTKKLEEAFIPTERTFGNSPPSAEQINAGMAKAKHSAFSIGAIISGIRDDASNLFNNIFESIKNLSSKVADQIKSVNTTLAESKTLLSKYPEPTAGLRAGL